MDIQKKLRSAAHFTVAMASDALEAQRLRFYVRDIQKKQLIKYQELGQYIAAHQTLLKTEDAYVMHCFQQLGDYAYKLHHLDRQAIEESASSICPVCGSYAQESANFCANCGSRLS